jgi:hypothetical protein
MLTDDDIARIRPAGRNGVGRISAVDGDARRHGRPSHYDLAGVARGFLSLVW